MKLSDLQFLQHAEQNVAKLADYEEMWQADRNFSNAVARFSELVADLNEYGRKWQAAALENKKSKKSLRKKLAAVTVKLAKQARVYAMDLDDANLKKTFAVNAAEMNRISDEEVIPFVTPILDILKSLNDSLILYGITAEDTQSLAALLSEYAVCSTDQPANDNLEPAGFSLNKLIQDIRTEIVNLETLSGTFRNPELSARYESCTKNNVPRKRKN